MWPTLSYTFRITIVIIFFFFLRSLEYLDSLEEEKATSGELLDIRNYNEIYRNTKHRQILNSIIFDVDGSYKAMDIVYEVLQAVQCGNWANATKLYK